MRFLADENVSRLVVERLRLAGHDIASIPNLGASDSAVLAAARDQDLVLITDDRDFGELVIRQKLRAVGVVLIELDRLSNVAEADRVTDAISSHAEKLAGHLAVIEPARVRFRPLAT
jgi:predicted nuclease of predicted toxin-antitoxin system